jgi:hypothetical protein
MKNYVDATTFDRARRCAIRARDAKKPLFAKKLATVPIALVAKSFLRICAHCAHRRGARACATTPDFTHLVEATSSPHES